MTTLARVLFVALGLVAVGSAGILLFALAFTTGSDHIAGRDAVWVQTHLALPSLVSAGSYLVVGALLLLTLIPHVRRPLGLGVVAIGLLAVAAGLLLWLWNTYLGKEWPLGLVLATLVCIIGGWVAYQGTGDGRQTAGIGLAATVLLAGSVATLLRVLSVW